MSAENDIRLAFAAYTASLPVTKPKITLSVFQDGEIQLFLHDSDHPSVTHAQGGGKTLDEAATNLKAHLVKRLAEVKAKDEEDLAKMNEVKRGLYERIDGAIKTLSSGEKESPGA
jgi:hypothetical protein